MFETLSNSTQILRNKAIVYAILIFQAILTLDILTVIYIVVIESDVSLITDNFVSSIILLISFYTTVFIFNLLFIAASLTRVRTTTMLIPLIITVILFIVLFITLGELMFAIFNFGLIGILVGIIYSYLYYGPAIWLYLRFRMAFFSIIWLSITFLSSILVANAFKIESGTLEAATSLLRPDYLLITGIFYFLMSLLLILDNSQALARWRKIPEKYIKLPLKSIVAVLLILIITTIISNIISPFIWKALWEETEGGNNDKITEADFEDFDNEGRSGNLNKEKDTNKMNPNQSLKDKLSTDDSSSGDIFFIISTDNPPQKGTEYYWKMEYLDKFSAQKGFYTDFNNTIDSTKYLNTSFTSEVFLDFNTSQNTLSNNLYQLIVFNDFETNWVIGANVQKTITLLNGKSRDINVYNNGSTITSKIDLFKKMMHIRSEVL
jgi:hypothetical protein